MILLCFLKALDMKKILLGFCIFILNIVNTYAWNSLGHRLAAQIAYDNMDVKSKKLVNSYNRLLNSKGRKFSLIDSAVWMDTLYADRYKSLRKLHYIDLPLVVGDIKAPKLENYNAVFGVQSSEDIFKDPKSSKLDKALAFRILWHVIADIHQPMHTISRYSKRYPEGDRGGNLEILSKNKVAKNLHAYWDRGGGVFYSRKPYTKKQIKELEAYILKKWPCDKENANLNPQIWVQESHEIAVNFAYGMPFNYAYQRKAQEIALERIAIAGCRLAAVMDNVVIKD